MKKLTSLSLALVLSVSAATVQAASIVAAERAYEQKDYAAALEELETLVKENDTDALYLMGKMYRNGEGVTKNHQQAETLFASAARQGHLKSVNALRSIKNEAYKIEFDEYLPKAQQGDAQAQNRIGEMYEYGQGVTRDLDQALAWFRKAADQGSVEGWHNLARSYNFGNGTAVDFAKAEELFRRAANQGYADSMFFLGTLYATHNGTDTSVDSDVMAYAWMHSAAERGSVTARTIEPRLLMKLDNGKREEAEQLAKAFAGRFVTPFN